ncbi:MAG TPA: hypothetical protein VFF13_03835 [archaeon]|nr:hypothetical protein [archaeon]
MRKKVFLNFVYGATLFGILFIALNFSGCLAKPTNTLSECENKPNIELRDVCYSENASDTNNLSFCTQIINEQIRNACINSLP